MSEPGPPPRKSARLQYGKAAPSPSALSRQEGHADLNGSDPRIPASSNKRDVNLTGSAPEQLDVLEPSCAQSTATNSQMMGKDNDHGKKDHSRSGIHAKGTIKTVSAKATLNRLYGNRQYLNDGKISGLGTDTMLTSKTSDLSKRNRITRSHTTRRRDGKGNFCPTCAEIPFRSIFVERDPDYTLRAPLGTVEEVRRRQKDYDCYFCAFLIEICEEIGKGFVWWGGGTLSKHHGILLIVEIGSWYRELGITSVGRVRVDISTGALATAWICITTGPDAYGGVREPMFCLSRTLNPVDTSNPDHYVLPRKREDVNEASGWLNFDLLRQWIVTCRIRHGNACKGRSGFKRNTMDIKLIDTKSMEVVSKKGMQRYAALSYVWGGPRPRQRYQFRSNFRLNFASLPATIQDAIHCTSRLGLQYLWIDQYCIDQANEGQKRMQIEMMDLVYDCAEVVLIASDGASVHAGLSGISRPLKHSRQPAFTSGDLEIMATYVNCPYERDISEPWNQRGWTLQEGLLARRRICFGSSHYYMRCEEEVFSSLLPVDLSLGRIRMESLGSLRYSYGIMGIELKGDEWSFDTYANFVERYTRRKLTDPDDVHSACNGILNKFTENAGAAFFHGLPSNDISRALLWEVGTFISTQRRPKFPSWTWMGWIGRTLYRPWLTYSTPTPAAPILRNGDEADREAMQKHEELCATIARVLPMDNSEAFIEFSNPEQHIATTKSSNRLLTISSLVANIGLSLIRKNETPVDIAAGPEDYERIAWGDHWALLDSAGTRLLNAAYVWVQAPVSVFQERDYFFHTHPDVSKTLQAGEDGIVTAELVFIRHWPAVRADRKSDSWLFDMVSALVVVKADDGTAWRLAAVLLTREQWTSLQPRLGVIRLI